MAMLECAQEETSRRGIAVGLVIVGVLFCASVAERGFAADGMEEPKSIRKTCGSCPEGYATTGRTNAPELCKDGDPVLVQCVPLGSNMLSVCGSCPEGYNEIGRSNVPSRCGSVDGGLVSQCQAQQLGSSMPDPSLGGVRCPPDCGSTAAPGQGASPPPPKFRPTPESK
ncbi:MAG: hypothetical protein GDA65_17480 [Nitrospira sp. CR1.1]|jgi:hypothetical protein|nr:hypothetical protein [Nitrospira sp. CR1.1]